MKTQPFFRTFLAPAAICAVVYVVAMATVLQLSLRTYVPGSLDPGNLTLANFIALLKPLYARVFLNTVWICFLTAFGTLIVSYPLAYALVHIRNPLAKSAVLITAITPLFLGEVVRTYSWIIVFGNQGFANSMLLRLGLINEPVQFMFTTFAVVVALVHVTIPVMVIMLATALAHIEPDYVKAAESLGAGPISSFSHHHASLVDARDHRRGYNGLCLDIQRIRHSAADWRRPRQYGFQPCLSTRICQF